MSEAKKKSPIGGQMSLIGLSTHPPKTLRYSLFVHSYALLEHALLRIADHFRRARKLKLSPSDLMDEGITRARTYLKKVVLSTIP